MIFRFYQIAVKKQNRAEGKCNGQQWNTYCRPNFFIE